VTDVHGGLRGQLEQAPHGAIELMRIATGEVGSCAAHVGHEERVADEHRAIDEVGHVGGCVARHQECLRLDVADHERLAVLEEVVELASVGQEAAL